MEALKLHNFGRLRSPTVISVTRPKPTWPPKTNVTANTDCTGCCRGSDNEIFSETKDKDNFARHLSQKDISDLHQKRLLGSNHDCFYDPDGPNMRLTIQRPGRPDVVSISWRLIKGKADRDAENVGVQLDGGWMTATKDS